MAIKSTGIVRNVDELGRVVLPKELRRERKIEPKNMLEIYVKDESIYMKKYVPENETGEGVGSVGIARPVDDLGRMVIPKETRRILKIEHKDLLEIYVDDEGCIILKKYEPTCTFCNNAENLITFENRKVCRECIEKLSAMLG